MRLMHPARDTSVVRETFPVCVRSDGSPLLVDLARPSGGVAGSAPVAILLHGGVPAAMKASFRSSEFFRDWAAVLASRGVASLAFDHGLDWPQVKVSRALAELDQVLGWLAGAAAAERLDLSRVTAVGFSGAGLLIGEILAGERPLAARVMAALYPLTAMPAEGRFAGTVDAAWAEAVDLARSAGRVARAGRPLLIARAGEDDPVSLQALDSALSALRLARAPLEVVDLPGAVHGFDATQDNAATWAVVDRVCGFVAAEQ